MELKEAIDALLQIKTHEEVLKKFVNKIFNEKKAEFYSKNRISAIFYILKSYKIIDKNSIEIEVETGTGDYTYIDNIIVDIRPYIRDSRIDKLLND